MITGYSIFLIAAAVLTAFLAVYTGWYRRLVSRSATGMVLLLTAITLYLSGAGMELAGTDLAGILFWVKIEYFGIASLPPLLLIVVLRYTGQTRYISPVLLALLSIIPGVTLALVLTENPLFYQTTSLNTSGPFPMLAFTTGPWYYVNICNSFMSQVVGTALLIGAYRRSTRPLYKKQILILATGVVAPFIAFILYVAGLSPIPHMDLAPFALVITAVACTVGVFSFRLFDLIPIAHSVILRQIPVGVMVVDDRKRVTELNPAAEAVFGLTPGEGIGRPAALLTDRFPELPGILKYSSPGVEQEVRHGDRHFTIEVVPLGDEGEQPSGSVLLIRDITLRRQTEELEMANRQLSLTSAITRHDIGNHLVVIDGYLEMLLEEGLTSLQAALVEKIKNATRRVRRMITFMCDYQAIGTSAPAWTDIRRLPERAAAEVALGGVQVENLLPSIEVLADPLIEKVIATLFENAVRHGKTVTRIELSARTDQDGLTFICEDDGAGVAADSKEQIFERGYGSNTGLGLFLAREILSITGMTITETGSPGAGARFEIRVPHGRYRTQS